MSLFSGAALSYNNNNNNNELCYIGHDTFVYTSGNVVVFHNLETNEQQLLSLPIGYDIDCISVNTDKSLVAIAIHELNVEIQLYSYPQLKLLSTIKSNDQNIFSLSKIVLSNDGRFILGICNELKHKILCWCVEDGDCLINYEPYDDEALQLILKNDSNNINDSVDIVDQINKMNIYDNTLLINQKPLYNNMSINPLKPTNKLEFCVSGQHFFSLFEVKLNEPEPSINIQHYSLKSLEVLSRYNKDIVDRRSGKRVKRSAQSSANRTSNKHQYIRWKDEYSKPREIVSLVWELLPSPKNDSRTILLLITKMGECLRVSNDSATIFDNQITSKRSRSQTGVRKPKASHNRFYSTTVIDSDKYEHRATINLNAVETPKLPEEIKQGSIFLEMLLPVSKGASGKPTKTTKQAVSSVKCIGKLNNSNNALMIAFGAANGQILIISISYQYKIRILMNELISYNTSIICLCSCKNGKLLLALDQSGDLKKIKLIDESNEIIDFNSSTPQLLYQFVTVYQSSPSLVYSMFLPLTKNSIDDTSYLITCTENGFIRLLSIHRNAFAFNIAIDGWIDLKQTIAVNQNSLANTIASNSDGSLVCIGTKAGIICVLDLLNQNTVHGKTLNVIHSQKLFHTSIEYILFHPYKNVLVTYANKQLIVLTFDHNGFIIKNIIYLDNIKDIIGMSWIEDNGTMYNEVTLLILCNENNVEHSKLIFIPELLYINNNNDDNDQILLNNLFTLQMDETFTMMTMRKSQTIIVACKHSIQSITFKYLNKENEWKICKIEKLNNVTQMHISSVFSFHNTIIVGSNDGSVHCYQDNKSIINWCSHHMKYNGLAGLSWDSNHGLLVTSGNDGGTLIWHTKSMFQPIIAVDESNNSNSNKIDESLNERINLQIVNILDENCKVLYKCGLFESDNISHMDDINNSNKLNINLFHFDDNLKLTHKQRLTGYNNIRRILDRLKTSVNDKDIDMETTHVGADDVLNELKEVKKQLDEIVNENENCDEIEQLSRMELSLDPLLREKLEEMGKKRANEVHNQIRKENIARRLQINRIKKECYDSIQCYGKCILPFPKLSPAENGDVVGFQLHHRNSHISDDSTKHRVSTYVNINGNNLIDLSTMNNQNTDNNNNDDEKIDGVNEFIILKGSHFPHIKKLCNFRRIQQMEAEWCHSTHSVLQTAIDDDEREPHDLELRQLVTETKTPYIVDSKQLKLSDHSIVDLLFHPLDLCTNLRRLQQMYLLSEIVRNLKFEFNNEFNKVMDEKVWLIGEIGNKIKRIVEVERELCRVDEQNRLQENILKARKQRTQKKRLQREQHRKMTWLEKKRREIEAAKRKAEKKKQKKDQASSHMAIIEEKQKKIDDEKRQYEQRLQMQNKIRERVLEKYIIPELKDIETCNHILDAAAINNNENNIIDSHNSNNVNNDDVALQQSKRALDAMMGGTLKVDKGVNLTVLERGLQAQWEEWMDEEEHSLSDEQKQKLAVFLRKEASLMDQLRTHTRNLTSELKKLQTQLLEIQLSFGESLKRLFQQKMLCINEIHLLELQMNTLQIQFNNDLHSNKILKDLIEPSEKLCDKDAHERARVKELEKYYQKACALLDEYKLKEKSIDRKDNFRRDFATVGALEWADWLYRVYRTKNRTHNYSETINLDDYKLPDDLNVITNQLIDELNTLHSSHATNQYGDLFEKSTRKKLLSQNGTYIIRSDYKTQAQAHGMQISVDLWNLVAQRRRKKFEITMHVKLQNEIVSTLKYRLESVKQYEEQLRYQVGQMLNKKADIETEQKLCRLNGQIFFRVPNGIVELEQTSTVIPDMSNALLLRRSLVEDVNKNVVRKALDCINILKDMMTFKKGIKTLKWHHDMVTLQLDEQRATTQELQLLRVTKSLQQLIKIGGHESHEQQQLETLERKLEHKKQILRDELMLHEEDYQDIIRKKRKLERENKRLKSSVMELEQNVHARMNVRKPITGSYIMSEPAIERSTSLSNDEVPPLKLENLEQLLESPFPPSSRRTFDSRSPRLKYVHYSLSARVPNKSTDRMRIVDDSPQTARVSLGLEEHKQQKQILKAKRLAKTSRMIKLVRSQRKEMKKLQDRRDALRARSFPMFGDKFQNNNNNWLSTNTIQLPTITNSQTKRAF